MKKAGPDFSGPIFIVCCTLVTSPSPRHLATQVESQAQVKIFPCLEPEFFFFLLLQFFYCFQNICRGDLSITNQGPHFVGLGVPDYQRWCGGDLKLLG